MNRCSYDICSKTSLVRGLCEQHFLLQFVQPLQKERRNSEDVLALLNANIAAHAQELYKAKHPNVITSPRTAFQRPDGTYTNTAMAFCHNCWKGFDNGFECLQHEEDCKISKPSGAKRRSGPSIPKQHEILVDEGEIDSNV